NLNLHLLESLLRRRHGQTLLPKWVMRKTCGPSTRRGLRLCRARGYHRPAPSGSGLLQKGQEPIDVLATSNEGAAGAVAGVPATGPGQVDVIDGRLVALALAELRQRPAFAAVRRDTAGKVGRRFLAHADCQHALDAVDAEANRPTDEPLRCFPRLLRCPVHG